MENRMALTTKYGGSRTPSRPTKARLWNKKEPHNRTPSRPNSKGILPPESVARVIAGMVEANKILQGRDKCKRSTLKAALKGAVKPKYDASETCNCSAKPKYDASETCRGKSDVDDFASCNEQLEFTQITNLKSTQKRSQLGSVSNFEARISALILKFNS